VSELEQAVIKAAREVVETWQINMEPMNERELLLAQHIQALDESLRPDPWQLLERMYAYHNHKGGMAMEDPRGKVHAALEWRRTHEE
jgi:hypothetical protein